jgi:hypothetical protein
LLKRINSELNAVIPDYRGNGRRRPSAFSKAPRSGRIVPLGAGRGIFLSGMILFAGVGLICLSSFRNLAFKRTYVENTHDRKSLTTRELPGFVYQRKDSEELIHFRQTIAPGFHLNEGMNALAKVIAVRKWVRDRQSDKSEDWQGLYTDDSEDPEVLLEEQRSGLKSACRRFSYILTGALLSIGMQARLVCASDGFSPSSLQHNMVEVWIEDLGKWVLVDPTLDTLIYIDGSPASLMDLYLAAKNPGGHSVEFPRGGSRHLPAPTWDGYVSLCKHIFVSRTNAIFDGYRIGLIGTKRISFLHLVDPPYEQYPETRKELAGGCSVLFACASAYCLWRFCRTILARNRMLQVGQILTVEETVFNVAEDGTVSADLCTVGASAEI